MKYLDKYNPSRKQLSCLPAWIRFLWAYAAPLILARSNINPGQEQLEQHRWCKQHVT